MSFLQKLPFHLLALFVIVCWGLTPVSTKVLYDYGMGPWAVLALRVVLAYGVLIFLSPKTIYAGTPRDEGLCVLLGIALVPVYYGLQNVALVSGDAATVAITATMAPILIGFAGSALFRKPMHWLMGLGACAAGTGLVLLAVDSCILQEMPLSVIWWSLGAAAGFALYSMLLRAAGDLPPLLMLRKSLGYGLLASIPFYYSEFETEAFLLSDPVVLGNILFLSIGALAVCWALWQVVVRRIGADAGRHLELLCAGGDRARRHFHPPRGNFLHRHHGGHDDHLRRHLGADGPRQDRHGGREALLRQIPRRPLRREAFGSAGAPGKAQA